MKKNQFDLAKYGENMAYKYFLDAGFELVARNFQYYRNRQQGRLGELDLVFFDSVKKVVHVVEVKSREGFKFGQIIDQISYSKLRNLHKTYQYFLYKYKNYTSLPAQLDIATVSPNAVEQIQVYWNAYSFDRF
jgi:Holliday junction resolvase-like predicted endonuclease